MKQLDVRFKSGRDVLNAYWGYLSDGGLVIERRGGVNEGQSVALDVRITSSNSRYSFFGRVVKRRPDGRIVIAFSPGEPHDMLLTEALAETDQVPARRHRRYNVDADGSILIDNLDEPVCVVNISASGCCLRMKSHANTVDVGSRVEVSSDGFSATGTIVWSRHTERGVRFDSERETEVKNYVSTRRG